MVDIPISTPIPIAITLGTGTQLDQRRGPSIQISQVQAIFNKVGQLVSIRGKFK